MRKLTLNLSKYRLVIKIGKRRGASIRKALLPSFVEIDHIRSGSKTSRFFRYIFENKNFKKVFGVNLALIVALNSFLPTPTSALAEAEQTVVMEQNVPLVTERSVQYPTDPIVITQGFRIFHPGLDLDGITGDTIKPIMGGVVEAISKSNYAYGNAVIVDHKNGFTSLYAHLSKIEVREGQEVDTDTKIGEMGATGHAFGDHLHLEVHKNGVPVNPTSILPLPKI